MKTAVVNFKKWLGLCVAAIVLLAGCRDSQFARNSVEAPVAQFYGDLRAPHTAAVRWQVVDQALMERVCATKSLRELSVVTAKRDGTPILPQIAKLPKLETLTIIEAPIHDDELSALSELSSLTSLELSRTGISGAGLRHLTKLRLKRLVIREKNLTAEGLEAIASMSELEELELSLPDIQWADMPKLASTKSLRLVTLAGGSYSFREHGGLKWLSGAKNLERLNLSGGNLNDRTMQTVSTFERLRWITIGPSLISEDSLKYFTQLQHLSFVEVADLDFSQAAAMARLADRAEEEPLAKPLRG